MSEMAEPESANQRNDLLLIVVLTMGLEEANDTSLISHCECAASPEITGTSRNENPGIVGSSGRSLLR